jgi:hypothetical protein
VQRLILSLLFASSAFACGSERWAVKTSADKDAQKVNLSPIISTISDLNQITPPTREQLDAKPDSRFPAELRTYKTQGYLVGFKREADQDFHIVIADPDDPRITMIVEMPSEECVPQELRNDSAELRAAWQVRFGKATAKFKVVFGRSGAANMAWSSANHKIKVEIVGIGFFDFLHNQTGVAKNGFELHRVLSWKEIF